MKSETFAAKAVEKTLRGKVQKQTFPPRLEIPQKTRDSHFSHSLDCCWILFPWWTHWFRPKPAELAPFITGPNNRDWLAGRDFEAHSQRGKVYSPYRRLSKFCFREGLSSFQNQDQGRMIPPKRLKMPQMAGRLVATPQHRPRPHNNGLPKTD